MNFTLYDLLDSDQMLKRSEIESIARVLTFCIGCALPGQNVDERRCNHAGHLLQILCIIYLRLEFADRWIVDFETKAYVDQFFKR